MGDHGFLGDGVIVRIVPNSMLCRANEAKSAGGIHKVGSERLSSESITEYQAIKSSTGNSCMKTLHDSGRGDEDHNWSVGGSRFMRAGRNFALITRVHVCVKVRSAGYYIGETDRAGQGPDENSDGPSGAANSEFCPSSIPLLVGLDG